MSSHQETLDESVKFANMGADAQEMLEEMLSEGKEGYEAFSYAIEAGGNYFISADLLETNGNHPRARIFYQMSADHLLQAMDLLDEGDFTSRKEYVDCFFDTSESYRASILGFKRVDDICVLRESKYECNLSAEDLTVSLGEIEESS